jgi:hypothetical protein
MLQDALNLFPKFKYFIDLPGSNTVELSNAPDGWLNTIVEYDRSKSYNGLLRTLTLPLKFVKKDAKMLRQQYALTRVLTKNGFRINEGDGRNNYSEIYNGRLDYSKKEDGQNGITVPAKTNDFSQNIDAYDSTPYSISLEDGVMVELPALALNETATLLPQPAPDGNIHSDYFPPIQVVNNTVNSINTSVQNVPYGQLRNPDFSATGSQFFTNRLGKSQNVLMKGSLTLSLFGGISGTHHLELKIVNAAGVGKYSFYNDTPASAPTTITVDVNASIPVVANEQLYLYMRQIDAETSNTGINIATGQLDFSYQTSTPATMCKALRGEQLFAKLLQQMNTNTDSAPNAPVSYQSFLLSGKLKPLVMTCSDSIRQALGSVYHAGDTLFQGIYKVLSGTCTYNGGNYTVGQQFTYTPTAGSFSGDGIAQKIQSIYTGAVYNVGDDLQPGGNYLVEGQAGVATYNNIDYAPGDTFKYVLGQDTFTATDDSIFLVQISEDPQIIISFADFFKAHQGIQGGNISFGVDRYTAINSTAPELLKQATGIPFLEELGYVYRAGVGQVKLGNVGKDWKSTPATDLLYNTIDIGYKDQQYTAINGQAETNSLQTYSSAILAVTVKLDLVSPVRADPYGIEQVRISQQDTAASRSDNDNFFLWIKDNPEVDEPFVYYRPVGIDGLMTNPLNGNPMIQGVDPSYYNWKITPKQNLNRGGPYLASIFYGMGGQQLTLTAAPKNKSLITTDINGVRVAERDPLIISQLPPPLFVPEYYDLTQGMKADLLKQLDVNPYADISFVVNNVNVYSFIQNFKNDTAKNSAQPLKLLVSPYKYNAGDSVR